MVIGWPSTPRHQCEAPFDSVGMTSLNLPAAMDTRPAGAIAPARPRQAKRSKPCGLGLPWCCSSEGHHVAMSVPSASFWPAYCLGRTPDRARRAPMQSGQRRYVPIQPANPAPTPPESGNSSSEPTFLADSRKRKRVGVQVACDMCRLKKTRVILPPLQPLRRRR